MHYAFDVWMRKEFPHVSFERYRDDVVIHCTSEVQAVYVKNAIGQRLKECRLEMNSDKTRIVYCKDEKPRGSHEHTSFTFLGYEFRVRRAMTRSGRFFENFGPAISPEAATAIRHEMRSHGTWHGTPAGPWLTWPSGRTHAFKAGSTITERSTAPRSTQSFYP